MRNSQVVRCVTSSILAPALVATLAAARKAPTHPRCFQTSRGWYVEGSLSLDSFAATNQAPKECLPDPTRSENDQLKFPPSVSLNVSSPELLAVYVRQRDTAGHDTWRRWTLPYNQITSLAFGFIPKQPGLSATQATIISTSVSGATAVLAISSGVNATWKASLGATGIGIAVVMGAFALKRHYCPKPEIYYLTIRYSDSPISSDQLEKLRTNELKYPQYVPKGEIAVFAMGMDDFWGVTHVLQSRTGLPLTAVATPGQASANPAK